MSDTDCFAVSYAESRSRFVRTASGAAATLKSYTQPGFRGPAGESISVDVALLGPAAATSTVFIVSGVHGTEAVAGGALLTDLLSRRTFESLPRNINAVLVHALNPWGASHQSRTNEGNVDVNRNFLDFQQPLPSNAEYPLLHAALCPDDIDGGAAQLTRLLAELARTGQAGASIDAIYRGQYEYSDGINFGGTAETWSNQVFRQIVREHLRATERVAFIDWHTGVGPPAEAVPLCFHDPNSIAARRLAEWHGDEVTAFGSQFLGGSAPRFTGLLVRALEDIVKPRDLYALVFEFGTKGNVDVVGALMIDRWLRFVGHRHADTAARVRTVLLDCFCPSDAKWRDAVLRSGRSIVSRTIEGLAAL